MSMSMRMNGYSTEREHRPSSETLVDLHVYLVPPDIWREKFNNALNQNINDTVSIGFIRAHPEMKVYALRDEIEQQLGSDIVPREYVFLKSVGRSLTRYVKNIKESTLVRKPKPKGPVPIFSKMKLERFVFGQIEAKVEAQKAQEQVEIDLKSKQEASLKVKHFLPPQAYAPELYLLEATPEVRQAIAASSEGSTRPQTRTSYDFDYAANRQSEDGVQNAKSSHTSNGAGYQPFYPTLPQIAPSATNPRQPIQHDQSPRSYHQVNGGERSPPKLMRTSPTPSHANRDPMILNGPSGPKSFRTDDLLSARETSDHPAFSDNTYNINSQETSKNNSFHSQNLPSVTETNSDVPSDYTKTFNTKSDNNRLNNPNSKSTTISNNQNIAEPSMSNKPVANPPRDLRVRQNPAEPRKNYGSPSKNHDEPSTNLVEPSSTSADRASHYDHPHTDTSSQHHMAGTPRRQAGHDDFPRPLSATPPPTHTEKSRSDKHVDGPPSHDGHSHGNHESQHKNDEDSGIAGFTPETYRDNDPLDRRKGDVANGDDRLKAPSPSAGENGDHDGSGGRHGNSNGEMSEWERNRQAEAEREQQAELDRQNRDAEEQRRHQESREKIAEEAKLMKTNSDEDMTKFPSPPPLRLSSPDQDTPAARARRKKQRKLVDLTEDELLRELEEAREARRAAERQREELVKHAKQMQTKTQNRRNHARDLWKKRYFDEKKKTGPLEEQSNRLRHELDIIHKKLLSTLEGPKEKATKLNDIKPGASKVGSPVRPLNNFKIQATRLQHEIEDIRRRVDHAKMKLTSEMKLRNQAETELRALRAELMQKKINLTLSRNSHLTTYAPPAADVNFVSARSGITPRS